MRRLADWLKRRPAVDRAGFEVTIGGEVYRVTEVDVHPDDSGAIVQLGCDRSGPRRRTRRSDPPAEPSWSAPDDMEVPWWREDPKEGS